MQTRLTYAGVSAALWLCNGNFWEEDFQLHSTECMSALLTTYRQALHPDCVSCRHADMFV